MGNFTLVTGGARSGKSTYAEKLAIEAGADVLYIATALAGDAEMQERIVEHRKRRPACWDTFEGYRDLQRVFTEGMKRYDMILLDCITVMLANLMWDELGETLEEADAAMLQAMETRIIAEVSAFVDAVKQQKTQLVAVTNEVGFGIVPENKVARVFRDLAGRMNQYLASRADDVYLVVCGQPLKIK